MKIESMTEDQERKMYEYREAQRLRGISCGRADRHKATKAINFFYEKLGKKSPMVWICDSPYMAQIWINIFKGKIGDNLRANLRDNLRDNLFANLGANLVDNLFANLVDNLSDNLFSNLFSNLVDNLGANLVDNLGANLRASLTKNLEHIPTYMWGQMDLYWIAFYMFPHLNLKKIHTDDQFEKLQAWEGMAESGFWYPFENIVFVSDKFKTLHQDNENRLHHESEMAMSFWDGYGFYSWHGVRVPEDIIKKQFTAKDINKEENAEVRRAMTEIMGAEEYLKQSGAKSIHKDNTGELFMSTVKDDEPIVMVKLKNSTVEPDGRFKDYFLRVPPTIKKAREAVAWTFGMTEKEYCPEVET